VLQQMRGELAKWRTSVGDPGISEEFRKGGWSAKYPTRSLEEWKQILAKWEDHVLHGGPVPAIIAPKEFQPAEGLAKPRR
jgi:hypothetical protein